jgi:hypothetical protein
MAKQTNHIAARLPDETLAAIDDLTGGNPRLRSEVIRQLLTAA